MRKKNPLGGSGFWGDSVFVGGLVGVDVDGASAELDGAGGECVEGVVLAETDLVAGLEACAALADDDGAGLSGLAAVFLSVTVAAAGHPPLWAFMAFFTAAFFCFGILFGNFKALAMEPMGHIAGVAAAVIGSLATVISLALGTVIGQAYDGTVLPLVLGFAAVGPAALAVQWWTARGP